MRFEIKDNEKLELIRLMFGKYGHFFNEISDEDIMFDKLNKLGLIDIWYNPVIERTITFTVSEEYTVGNVVFVEDCTQGSYGAKYRLGIVVSGPKWDSGCTYTGDDVVFVKINDIVWNLGKRENVVLLVKK